MKRKIAFTLAEVLITLTIIGIIAALTIPNLMQSYRKHEVEARLKEAYSLLSNTIKISEAENGPIQSLIDDSFTKGDYQNIETYFSEHYIEPYLKFSKKRLPENSTNNLIFKDVQVTGIDDTKTNALYYDPVLWVCLQLENGMYLGVQANTYWETLIFTFDINGGKGPNKIGYDTFYFHIDVPHKTRQPKYLGQLLAGIPVDGYRGDCDAKQDKGIYCARPIMMNGWKIPDDYPVKKW